MCTGQEAILQHLRAPAAEKDLPLGMHGPVHSLRFAIAISMQELSQEMTCLLARQHGVVLQVRCFADF